MTMRRRRGLQQRLKLRITMIEFKIKGVATTTFSGDVFSWKVAKLSKNCVKNVFVLSPSTEFLNFFQRPANQVKLHQPLIALLVPDNNLLNFLLLKVFKF